MEKNIKMIMETFDKLLDLLEEEQPERLNMPDKSDLVAYTNRYLLPQIKRLTQ